MYGERIQNSVKNKTLMLIFAVFPLRRPLASCIAFAKVVLLTSAFGFTLSCNIYAEDIPKQRVITGIQHCPGGKVIQNLDGSNKFGNDKFDRLTTMSYGMGKLVQGRDKKFYCEYNVLPKFSCESIEKSCTAKTTSSNDSICLCPASSRYLKSLD
ncbi:hypothetical protein [uncultured Cocleimonas sp.]|uniref:hypothetical protein n=1 Tax=uncultured Cocleimonas sp. TaxID=1051587 RepID=UPI002602E79F|nr:hypothetical protein [uncultured Cocleimonas sp.]